MCFHCNCVIWLSDLVNVSLEAVSGAHLDGKEVMVTLFELLMGRLLSDEQLGEISKAVE